MSGSHLSSGHSAPPARRRNSSSSGKIWILVVVLVIAIAALCFLLWQLFGSNIMDALGGVGGGGNATADIAPGIFTQVEAEYASGKNVAGNISVAESTQRPDSIPPEDDNVVLLDITWTGKNELAEPVYVTVSDPSFTDGDGLAVHHYNSATAAWDLLGTYTIRNNSVTFLADSFSPFAFQVISSNPEPTPEPSPEVTAEPTPTPEPTPEPTPAPISVVDYGSYPAVQTGAFAMVNELEDDQVYVVALVKDLPADAFDAVSEDEAEDEAEDEEDAEDTEPAEEETDGELTFSYVDAEDSTTTADVPAVETPDTPASGAAPVATVLVNLDGSNLRTVDMPLVQAEDGTWCLGGPITEGMLWTSNRDAYKNEHRFSLSNHDRYLNLDDNDANVILNDNRTRTRFLLEEAQMASGTATTLTYRNDDTFFFSSMEMAAEVVTDAAFPAGTVDENTQVSQPVYLGGAVPAADQSLYREVLHFATTEQESEAKQLVLFKVADGLASPAGLVTTLPCQITIPAISEETNLETMVIMDGDRPLMLGTDYTIAARVYNNSTVVVCINFIGNYTGQIVRTYAGTLIRTNATPETTPTPSPTPYVSGEGTTTYQPPANNGNTGGGNTASASDTTNVVPYDNSDGSDT